MVVLVVALQPANFNALKLLRDAPPSNIVKNKSAKVTDYTPTHKNTDVLNSIGLARLCKC